MDLIKLNADSRALIESVVDRPPPHIVAHYRELSAAGESADLINTRAASLVHDKVIVTPAEYQQLADLLALFPAGKEGYDYLSDPQGVLEKLVVAPS